MKDGLIKEVSILETFDTRNINPISHLDAGNDTFIIRSTRISIINFNWSAMIKIAKNIVNKGINVFEMTMIGKFSFLGCGNTNPRIIPQPRT